MRLLTIALLAPIASALVVSACDKPPRATKSLDTMDNELVNGTVANTMLGADTIMIDPAKACRNGDCRNATTSLAEAARRQAAHKPTLPREETSATNGIPGLAYSNAWATKIPAELPMMPGAILTEAAGRDTPCLLRIISFSVPGDRAAVLAWYTIKAKAAGYSVTRADKGSDAILVGDKADASYELLIGATANSRTSVDYVWTRGS